MTLEDSIPASGLGSARSTYRLNQIDKVRANGVGDLVSLPQLVVCGDQSSGKSSVLERITGIPFPREDGLCTRFPTEIILRHSSEPLRLTASISPNIQRPSREIGKLRRYRRTLTDVSELPNVISESATRMGIRGPESDPNADADTNNAASSFAHDVLRIEIVGPVGLHLTIVDIPGLIAVPSSKQSPDVHMVMEIAEKYLASTRTIILAVVPAGNDVVTQSVIQLATKHDPEGDRTVGIITKPDLINDNTEQRIARAVHNRDAVKLKLGFFLLKNPSPSESKADATAAIPSEASAQRERDFFDKPAWKKQNLASDRVGIDSLRRFLQVLLDRHIEKELPKVRSEIKQQLAVKESELNAMGTQRQSCNDVRTFLTHIGMRFHGLAKAALDGNYAGTEPDFFDKPGTRLRALVHESNEKFAETMRVRGQLRRIRKKKGSDEPSAPVTAEESKEENEESADEIGEGQIQVTEEEMVAWVRKIYRTTRGRELPGSHNHVLLAELFREQSSLWPSLANDHTQGILDAVTQWTAKATKACATDDNIRQKILTLCQDPLEKARDTSMDELQKLIGDEKRHPITYNHYYTDNIQKTQMDGQKAAIEQTIATVNGLNYGRGTVDKSAVIERLLEALRKNTVTTPDMIERACKAALDELAAYYKVSMKTFVDNICRQVIERHIMTALPLLFSPEIVATFSDDELMSIGSETEAERTKRNELQALVDGLRQSLKDLQGPA